MYSYIISDDGNEVYHDNLRIDDRYTLHKVLNNSPHIPKRMKEDIEDMVVEFRNKKWEFKGDGDGLGFLFDVWDKSYDDDEPIVETQIWFEDY
jgi:hypothetical protein